MSSPSIDSNRLERMVWRIQDIGDDLQYKIERSVAKSVDMVFRIINSPGDPKRKLTLNELGFTIDERDRLVMLDDPSGNKGYYYLSNKNERFAETRHEDYEGACRRVVETRLKHDYIEVGYIPGIQSIGPTIQPTGNPQVPVFFSQWIRKPLEAERLILLIGKSHEDPQIHSRHLWDSHGVNVGSIVNFVDAAHSSGGTGVIIANPGQRLWSTTQQSAMTYRTWAALPRHKAMDPAFEITLKNLIPENTSAFEHMELLLRDVVLPAIKANPSTPKLHIICVDNSVKDMIKLVQQKWDELKPFLNSIVVCNSMVREDDVYNEDFRKFWYERCKAYGMDNTPLDTPIDAAESGGLNNYFSSGESEHGENIFGTIYPKIIQYFDILRRCPDYKVGEPEPAPIPEPACKPERRRNKPEDNGELVTFYDLDEDMKARLEARQLENKEAEINYNSDLKGQQDTGTKENLIDSGRNYVYPGSLHVPTKAEKAQERIRRDKQ